MSHAQASRIPMTRVGKYGVCPPEQRTLDNVVFASKREMVRYSQLKMLERCGTIHDLELQPKFPLIVEGVLVCTYIADFKYRSLDNRTTIEDVKGARTEVYRIKSKLFHALHKDLRILET